MSRYIEKALTFPGKCFFENLGSEMRLTIEKIRFVKKPVSVTLVFAR